MEEVGGERAVEQGGPVEEKVEDAVSVASAPSGMVICVPLILPVSPRMRGIAVVALVVVVGIVRCTWRMVVPLRVAAAVSPAESFLVEDGPVVAGGPRGHGGDAHHRLEHGRDLFVGETADSVQRGLVIGPSAGIGGSGISVLVRGVVTGHSEGADADANAGVGS